MEGVRCAVCPVGKALVDSEGELVADVLAQPLPLQDELDDAGAHGRGKEVGLVRVEPARNKKVQSRGSFKAQSGSHRYSLSLEKTAVSWFFCFLKSRSS